jgi:hypothetical protein
VFQDLKLYGRSIIGLPATDLVDREGGELGGQPGPAECEREEALSLLLAAIGE